MAIDVRFEGTSRETSVVDDFDNGLMKRLLVGIENGARDDIRRKSI